MQNSDKQEENELVQRRNHSGQAFKLLQTAIDHGVASGKPQPFDFDEFKSKMHRKYAKSSLVDSKSDD